MNPQLITKKQDLTYLNWTRIRNSSGTAGSFLKAYYELGREKVYYKLSNFDSYRGIIGHECVNELIVDRLLTILGIEHLSYQLIHADVEIYGKIYDTWVCASRDFKMPGESKLPLDAYYQVEHIEKETPLEFCIRQGWGFYVYQMLVVDFLILNRDRHGANIEVLRDMKSQTVRLAPLFDHGLSLIFSCHDAEAVNKVEVLEDKPVQSFVGSHSVKENLHLIPRMLHPRLNSLRETDRSFILEGLDVVLSQEYLDVIWKMLWERWKYYEDFCRQR